MTLTEALISRSVGRRVHANDSVNISPDHIAMYEWGSTSDYCIDFVTEHATLDTSKLTMFIDHKLPARLPADTALHNQTLQWCRTHSVPVIHAQGIGHQYMVDQGMVTPGDLVVHFDRHVNILGAIGVFAVGSRLEIIMALGTGTFPFQVPESVRIKLTGTLADGVMGRDLYAHLLHRFGPALSSDMVLEFGGEGAVRLSIDSRMSICCQAMFLGCVTALFDIDQTTTAYFKDHFNRDVAQVVPGADADYQRVIQIDLADIEPYVVVPPSPKDAVTLSSVAGLPIQQGYIGSCASGRIEDLAIAARILKGRKIAHGSRLYVVPSSKEVMKQACRLGYMEILADAGAFISSSTCDFCSGRQGALADGERGISTGTLNVPGRMGNINADVYNASAASVAAALVTGRITDPRALL